VHSQNRLFQVIIPLIFAGTSNVLGLGAIFTIEVVLLGIGALLERVLKAIKNLFIIK
jgi:hypothetical protein